MFLGNKQISYTDSSKVLGVYVDEKLDFKRHTSFVLSKCWFAWHKLSSGTTRTEGMNSVALSLLFKTVVQTKLMYAAPLWLSDRLGSFKDLLAKAKLKILGSQVHISKTMSGLLTAIPPMEVTLETLTTKFILKGLTAADSVTAKILQIEAEPNHFFFSHITTTKRYLEWRALEEGNNSRSFIRNCSFTEMDPNDFLYSKETMDRYGCKLWDDSVKTSIHGILRQDTNVEELCDMIDTYMIMKVPLLTRALDRASSTYILDFVHGRSLRFQDFAYSYMRSHGAIGTSTAIPYCLECGILPDSPYHKLFKCTSMGVVTSTREQLHGISTFESNFHIPLIFNCNSNIKSKFRYLVKLTLDSCIFAENLLT